MKRVSLDDLLRAAHAMRAAQRQCVFDQAKPKVTQKEICRAHDDQRAAQNAFDKALAGFEASRDEASP